MSATPPPHVTIILPTYNEAENLPLMVAALLALPVPGLHLLIVDDNSPDGTGALADALAAQHPARVAVLHRPAKEGLGPAYIAGFRRALADGADVLIQMDTDFSHQPKYVPQLLARLAQGADVVIGSRYAPGGSVDERWSVFRKLLSWFANRVYVPLILNVPITDATGGFRAWRRRVLERMDLGRIRSNGYVFQVETAFVAVLLGFRLAEVPIHFPDRALGHSKMSFAVQREAALRTLQLRWRHGHLRRQPRPQPDVPQNAPPA